MPKGDIRDISPLLQKIRNFLLGRPHTLAVRFQEDLATRSPPLPDLPDGPSHRLFANYYCARDARREVKPPEALKLDATLIGSGSGCANISAKNRTPGNVYQWD